MTNLNIDFEQPDHAAFPPAIAEAVISVMAKVTFVAKSSENTFQKYNYASDGDILKQVQPAMAEAGLFLIQDEIARHEVADGRILAVTYGFRLVHKSGAVSPRIYQRTGMSLYKNERGNYDDKAANKCQTAARKYFILSLFLIPTGEDPDAHDGEARAPMGGATKDRSAPPPTPKPPAAQPTPRPEIKQTALTPEQLAAQGMPKPADPVPQVQAKNEDGSTKPYTLRSPAAREVNHWVDKLVEYIQERPISKVRASAWVAANHETLERMKNGAAAQYERFLAGYNAVTSSSQAID